MRITEMDMKKIREEEENSIETEKRVQNKAMDQREALIAAVRAQVEKERAAKEAVIRKEEEDKARYNKTSTSTVSDKQQFRTISAEEAKKLEERQKQRSLTGFSGVTGAVEEKSDATDSVERGLDGNVISSQGLSGESPTSENSVGLGGLGLSDEIMGESVETTHADENTIELDIDAIRTAMDASNKIDDLEEIVENREQVSEAEEVSSIEARAESTIIIDNSNVWESEEEESAAWVASSEPVVEIPVIPELDDDDDLVSILPINQAPIDTHDVKGAYDIDFEDEDEEIVDNAAEEEARRQAEEEARRQAEEEARRQAEEEARRKAEEEARRQAEEEARRKAEEEARRQAEEEARRIAEEEARRKAEEEARRQAEEEARRIAEEEARRQAEEEARRIAEEEARRKAEEEARRQAEEEARRIAEEEARRQAEEEARRKAEEEARRKAEEEARRKAEEEARRIAEEEARRKAEEEARRIAEEEARRKAEEEARRIAEEEARRIAEEEARRKAEEEARRIAEEEARRKAEEEARRIAEEEARRKAEEEARRIAEEEARRKAEEEARRIAEEEARRKAEEEARRQEELRKLAEEAAKKAEEARLALDAAKKAEEEAKRLAEQVASASGKVNGQDIAKPKIVYNEKYTLPEEASYLEKYMTIESVDEQIHRAITNLVANPKDTRHMVVFGQHGFGTTMVGEDIARSMFKLGICKKQTIAKIRANALNRANLKDAMEKLQGGCLIVESAGTIKKEKLEELHKLVNQDGYDVVVILTGKMDFISNLFTECPDVAPMFKTTVQLHRITTDDLVEIAENYIVQLGFSYDSPVVSKLKAKTKEIETGNIDRLLGIVDGAVANAKNRGIKSFHENDSKVENILVSDFE